MVKSKEKVSGKEASSKEEVSQFFERLVAYGGISTAPGIIYMWGDPDVLIPAEAFSRFQTKVLEKLGDEGRNLIIWSGRITGYQSSVVLEKKFGIPFIKVWSDNHEDMDNLINGATQDGYGFIKAFKYPDKGKPIEFSLSGTKCNIGNSIKEVYGKQEKPGDLFIMGMIQGGSDFLLKTNLSIKESKCVAKGDKECVFDIYEGKQQYTELSSLFKNAKIDQVKLEKNMESLYLKRPQKGSFLNVKKLKFGDGDFVFQGFKGVVVASRVLAPVFEYLKKRLSTKEYSEILDEFSKGYLNDIFKDLPSSKVKNTKDFLKLIEKLNLLGLGEFNLVNSSNKIIFIENKNNVISSDRKFLFGLSKEPTDEFITVLLQNVFEKFYQTKVNVIESDCISKGKNRCLFKISI